MCSGLSKRFDVNSLLAKLLDIYPLNVIVDDLEGFLTGTLQDVADELGAEITLNTGAIYANLTILFARGTEEPGDVGVTTGPAFFQAAVDKVGERVAVQGINN
ncbi:hypothetical protein N0V82_003152, partial [Gnomoniopsis sp. IMI 355080]